MAGTGCVVALTQKKGAVNGDEGGLKGLNHNGNYDFRNTLHQYNLNYNEGDEINPYEGINIDSLFYDEDSFVAKFQKRDNPVFFSINIQSLPSKFEKLKSFIVAVTNKGIQIDLIALQETWEIKYPKLFIIPGFQQLVYVNRTKGAGGGVGFYIRNGLSYKIINTQAVSQDRAFETLTLKIQYVHNTATKNIIVSNCYRSPTPIQGLTHTQQLEIFYDKLGTLLHEVSQHNSDTFVFLDANIDILKLNTDEAARQYTNTLHNEGFIITNTKATRMTGTSSTLIDHILTNSKTNTFSSGSIIEDISDHWITFFHPNLKKHKAKPKNVKQRLINKETLERFKTNLQTVNWDEILNCVGVDECYDKFWSLFNTLYDAHFPYVTTKFNKSVHKISNFMTKGLLTSRRNKLNLLKLSLTDPTPHNRDNYKQYRNIYNTLIRASKTLHINKRLKDNAKNPKKTWDTLKELTTGTHNDHKINAITNKDGMTLTDPKLMAEEFNNFFTSAGKKISESIDPIRQTPDSYLTTTNTPPPTLEFIEISQGKLINIINDMAPKNSNDIYGLSTKLIKYLKYELAPPLVHLFNLSIRQSKFPSKLKTSRTIPIFKAGDSTNCDNYRPISLLSAISKILEKFISEQLVNHLEYHKLIYEHQYGFQRNKSTVHSLLHLTNFVTRELNDRKFVVGVFLDLKKAFDVVPHDILLRKLCHLGIRERALEWFTSYLSGRSQQVEIEGVTSDKKAIDLSVLQGSILGPILFLCYINDLPSVTNLLSLLFADDTAGLKSGHDLKELIRTVNIEINKMANWFRANKMAVNISKTKYIIFKPKGTKIILQDNDGIYYDDNEIGATPDNDKIKKLDRIYNDNPNIHDRSYKLLGVYLDEHLSFDQHCKHVCTKIAQSNFIINRTKHLLPKQSLKTLYHALVHPHLLYCLPIYSCTSDKNIKSLEKIQKKAIRTITLSAYNAQTAPLFEAEQIMPLRKLIQYTQSILMHSIYHKHSPPSLHSTWITNRERHNDYALRNADDLYIPLARSDQVKCLTYFALPKMWNELYEQKYTPNPYTFKRAIKDHYLGLNNFPIPFPQ